MNLWCSSSGFPRPRSFALKRYGNEGSKMLAEEVARRGNYFMNLWIADGSPAPYSFIEAAEMYSESAAFIEWLQGQPLQSPCYVEALQIRKITPAALPA